MLRSMLKPAIAAAIGLAAVTGAANAQEVIVEENYMAYDGYAGDYDPVLAPEATVTVETAPSTRVYGWVAVRPESCGEFKYWDGTSCLDARVVPPDTGPRF